MPKQNLSTIRQQIARLEAQARKLESADAEKKRKAVAEVRALMKKLGVTAEDLSSGAAPRAKRAKAAAVGGASRPRAKVPVKFRNAETGDAWSGRGRTPKWLAALEAAGRRREEFAVQ